MTRTNDRQNSQTGIVLLGGSGEIVRTHGQQGNKTSLATVSQESANSLPMVYQIPRNTRSTPSSGKVRKISLPTRIAPHETISEAVPKPNGRPLGDSILRIRNEMLDHEARHRMWSEELPEPLLTLREAADYLRLTPAALYTQRHRGHKPGALGIRIGRKILYRPSDINRYLDELLAENQVSLHR